LVSVPLGCYAREIDQLKAREGANVDIEFCAIEHDGEATAHIRLELRGAPGGVLCLPVMIWRAAFVVEV